MYVQDILVSPQLDKTAAQHIFDYISSRKIGRVLKILTIHHVSTETFEDWNQDPGHTVLHCTTDPITNQPTIQETLEGGNSDGSRWVHERTQRENDEEDQQSIHAHPPSALLTEIMAHNSFWQSLAPKRPELQIVYQDYEIRLRNDPARLVQYEKKWRVGKDEDEADRIDFTDVIAGPEYREQMEELLSSKDEEARDGVACVGDKLRRELERRLKEGWDLWAMEGVKAKDGSEGFLFDRL